jgi:phage virion morphogenesis protein
MTGASHERSGVRLAIEFDDQAIQAHLAKLVAAEKGGFKAVRREVGAYMLGQIQDAFDNQKLFDGSAMPLSEAAKGGVIYKRIKEGKRKGKLRKVTVKPRKTLIDTRKLYRSYTYNLTGQAGLEVGSDMVYAAIHQFGGETGSRKGRFNMVARPVVGMTDDHKAYVGDLMLAELRRLT